MDLFSLIVIVVVLLAIGLAAFFVYRNSALKAQLTETRLGLQSQVDAANTKAGASAAELAQLQSQMDQAKAEVASAKATAKKATGQVAALQAQLEQARSEAANIKAAAEKSSIELANLKAQLEAQAQPQDQPQDQPQAQPQDQPQAQPQAQAEAAAPTPDEPAQATQPAPVSPETPGLQQLPLNAAFKKTAMSAGNALVLQNTSTASLPLTVRFSNARARKEFQLILDPGATKEMGWLGAWVLAAGDKVEIQSPGYETITKTAP